MANSPRKFLHHITDFLALKRSTVGVLAMVILILLGERMAERFLPIYLIALGGGALTIGLLNGLDNFLSAVYSFLGGYLSDRFGTKKALLFFNFAAMFGFCIVILIPAWQAVIIGAVFFLSWSAISLPATMNLITEVLPMEKRTMGVSMLALVRRIPMALGPLLGGVCIGLWGEKDGVRAAFVVALLLAAIATVMQQFLVNDAPKSSSKNTDEIKAEKNPLKLLHHMSPDLKQLLVADILIRYCEQIPYAFVVVWCMKTIAHPVTAVQFGLLTTIEMVTALFVYIPVAYFADKGGKKPFVLITFIFFTLFPLALLFCQSFALLVPVFMLRGLKEFGEPTRKALIMELAPEGRKAAVFGLYYMLRDIMVALAAFGGAFLWMISPAVNFITAFSFGLIGSICYAIWGRDISADTQQ
ncbi:MAG: MFS transporter [Thermodesulfobacteriota bacterium]|nr:MFS transporter [Thermodesulfobacteriota bacterium]